MIILDTNVISEVIRATPAEHVAKWFAAQTRATVFTTSVTQAEIFYAIKLLPDGKKREALLIAVTNIFKTRFNGRVLPFDDDASQIFADIASERRKMGRPIRQFDAQIAAIARARGAVVATRDLHGFAHCGVELIDPWSA